MTLPPVIAVPVAKYGIRTIAIIVLTVLVLLTAGYGWWKYQSRLAEVFKHRNEAIHQAELAKAYAAAAMQSEASHEATVEAHDANGRIEVEVNLPAEQSAQRIETMTHEPKPAANGKPAAVDYSGMLDELEEGTAAYRAAAKGRVR